MTLERIIFQHIPKTAGNSLAPLFSSQFDRKKTFVCGSKDGVLADFLNLEQSSRNSLQLLIGHVDYGIHDQFEGQSKYVTFLRDPVDRVLSHYYFIRSQKSHRYHEQARQMDIREFIRSGIRPRMNNCMTRMISGINPAYGQRDDRMLDTALGNIQKDYCFIGLVRFLDESVERLIQLMGWKPVCLHRLNVTKYRPDVRSISPGTREVIQRYNHVDILLYDMVRKKFRARKKRYKTV